MPNEKGEEESRKSQEKRTSEKIMEDEYIPLVDLVYAPLYALAQSNHRLRAQVIDEIRSIGTSRQIGQEEIIQLKNINIAFDQLRPEPEEGCSVDSLQVQVPLLSIIPMTNLNVKKAEIDFSAEIKAMNNEETGEIVINARICAPEQRNSDFLPKVSYKMQIISLPATEGILRLTDALNSSQVAKQTDSRPVEANGGLASDEQKSRLAETKKLKNKINRLKQLHQKISDMIAEQERLEQISGDTRELDKNKYLTAQSEVINRIMEYEDQIIDMEIQKGLDKNYE